MRKLLAGILALGLLFSTNAFAGKLIVNDTNNGQFTDLEVNGGDSTYTKRDGMDAIIDLNHLSQSSATGAIPVVTMTQSDTDESFVNYVGTSATTGSSTSVITYTTAKAELGAQAGAIKVKVNGSTYWMHFYAS